MVKTMMSQRKIIPDNSRDRKHRDYLVKSNKAWCPVTKTVVAVDRGRLRRPRRHNPWRSRFAINDKIEKTMAQSKCHLSLCLDVRGARRLCVAWSFHLCQQDDYDLLAIAFIGG